MNEKAPNSSDVVVVKPASKDTPKKETFAGFLKEIEALKKNDDAAMQGLMVRIARAVAEGEYDLTEEGAEKLTELQADKLVTAIAKTMGHRLEPVRGAWKKRLAAERKAAKAKAAEKAAAAGPGPGPGGAGAGSYGPSGSAGLNQSFAGAFGQYCLDESGLYWCNKKKWFRIAGPFEILSSLGKTTMQRIAASSWGSGGDGGYMRSWRTTANALEGTLTSMSDTLLVLDELAQAAGHEIGAVVYMITGSVGKTRMRRDSSIRSPYKWRVLALSSGEASMAARIGEEQKVKRSHAGQLVRALDIPAKRALGMFDQVRPNFDAEAFAKEMQVAASTSYGTAGPTFVRELIERGVTGERIRKLAAEFVAVALKGITKDHGQVARVAERFGLIAVAGKLATEFGIVSWPEGQVAKDALELFKDWLAARGGAAPAEIGQMIAQVRRFIEAHGDARFDDVDPPPNNPITGLQLERRSVINRAGWRQGKGEDRRWYVPTETWRGEICVGFDSHEVAKTLAAHGMLEPGGGGKMSQVVRLPEQPPKRFYVLTPSIFEG